MKHVPLEMGITLFISCDTVIFPTALYNSEPDPVFPILSEYTKAKTLVSQTSAHLRVQTFSFILG